jgi:hypothetical protein
MKHSHHLFGNLIFSLFILTVKCDGSGEEMKMFFPSWNSGRRRLGMEHHGKMADLALTDS